MPTRFGHWTPRYLYNRIKWGVYQRQNMDKPWLTPYAIEMLTTLILSSDIGIEWGSGRSTCWFASRLKHLTSIEDNPKWYQRVSTMITNLKITNVTYRLVTQPAEDATESDYVKVAENFADRSLGLALVDGSAREFCTHAIIPKIAPGGLLIIDNINWYLDHPTRSPYSRTGKGHLNSNWTKLAEVLSTWRMIWTTCGVSDTAIWIRPNEA